MNIIKSLEDIEKIRSSLHLNVKYFEFAEIDDDSILLAFKYNNYLMKGYNHKSKFVWAYQLMNKGININYEKPLTIVKGTDKESKIKIIDMVYYYMKYEGYCIRYNNKIIYGINRGEKTTCQCFSHDLDEIDIGGFKLCDENKKVYAHFESVDDVIHTHSKIRDRIRQKRENMEKHRFLDVSDM